MQLPHRHGAYVLLEELGRGGMAAVYRAKYLGTEGFVRNVAIKRILPAWSRNPEFAAMLIDEARILTQLQHQNIVPVYELGVDQGVYFIAMEYVAGWDLRSLLLACQQTPAQQLPAALAYYIVTEILQGLVFAHTQVNEQGVPLRLVHRDISPQNILISYQGEVKITDFGIAKGGHRQHETLGAQVKGKYAYMAPEQARGEAVDHRVDVFAVGVLLYELLAGHPLFDAPNDLKVLERVREARLPPRWAHRVHPAMRAVLQRALAASKQERYPTAGHFLADVSTFVTNHRFGTHRVAFAEFLQAQVPDLVSQVRQRGTTPLPEALVAAMGAARTRGYTQHGSRALLRHRYRLAGFLVVLLLAGAGLAAPGDTYVPFHTLLRQALPLAMLLPTELWRAARRNYAALRTQQLSRGTLTVQARPWGYVSVPGVARRMESPATLTLAAGRYQIAVEHEQHGRRLNTAAEVRGGRHTQCRAVFGSTPRIWCQ